MSRSVIQSLRLICFMLIALFLANLVFLRETDFHVTKYSMTFPEISSQPNNTSVASYKADSISSYRVQNSSQELPMQLSSSAALRLDTPTINSTLPNSGNVSAILAEAFESHQRTMSFGRSWRPLPDSAFKIPFPVFLASLPKSGTTSIHTFFRCGRARSVHTYCPKNHPSDRGMARLGVLIQQNIENDQPPFQGCGDKVDDPRGRVNVFTDVGYVLPRGPCYYPSLSALDALYKSHPNMTIMLSTRNSTNWYNSVRSWQNGDFMRRLLEFCDFLPRNISMNELVEFYDKHNDHVRRFAQQHPSITYVEFAIDSPTTGQYLEQITGIPSVCWGHHLPGKQGKFNVSNIPKKGKRRRKKAKRSIG